MGACGGEHALHARARVFDVERTAKSSGGVRQGRR